MMNGACLGLGYARPTVASKAPRQNPLYAIANRVGATCAPPVVRSAEAVRAEIRYRAPEGGLTHVR